MLRDAHETAKMTQEELSLAAKVDRSYISQLENDKKSPTVDLLLRICEALGCQASKVIAAIEARPKPKSKSK